MKRPYAPIKHLANKLRYGTWASYFFLGALISLFCYWGLARPHFSPVVFSLQSVPLLALLPGMLSKSYRSFSWLCFVLLIYFIFAVERALTSVATLTDIIFLALVITLFITSMMTSRWLQRTLKTVPQLGSDTKEDC
ncbi:MAG: putative membrane protein [Lentisphaeria bacterium]|jgi:uncharacterized membrane protein